MSEGVGEEVGHAVDEAAAEVGHVADEGVHEAHEGVDVVVADMHHEMLVASVHKTSKMMSVTLSNGDTVMAPVPVTEVTLSDETGKHGSRTMTFVTAEEQAYAASKYHQGEMVSVVL